MSEILSNSSLMLFVGCHGRRSRYKMSSESTVHRPSWQDTVWN